jgi:hypothetical protein
MQAAQQAATAAAAAAVAQPAAGSLKPRFGKKGHHAAEEKESAVGLGYNTSSTLAPPVLSAQGTPLPAPGTFLVAEQRRARSVQPKEDPSLVEVPEPLKPLLGEKSDTKH